MDGRAALLLRIRILLWSFIFVLVLAGVTAIPLPSEVDWLTRAVGAGDAHSWVAEWIHRVQHGLRETAISYPFLFYGTDWLAFGHFVIAIAFWGPIKDPVKNVWVVEFGMISCALVIPFALAFGAARGIPFEWRLIDCSFGVLGLIGLWPCYRMIRRLEPIKRGEN